MGHARAATGEIGFGLGAALLAVDGAFRQAREAQAWARADAAAEQAVHALGQRLLRSQASERALIARIAELEAEVQAQRARACRAEGQLLGLRRRAAA
ncbi:MULTISPECIES: hypothetical protein [Methylorubrum]|uniref:Uncharacterized protein n=2 Tax=Methylorubrum TaxID=2282523 RepID=A0ABU9ZAP8_9HYPH|nr:MULTISPECIES: hypothetical protein [Methylorubrum]MBA8915081.1 uncharacterized protein YlxW (UPF0749 family) [Methylorubrum thiocyanatum]MBK3403573.1 hypothetical protein [Methylorubrum rhodesianum]MBY0143952.1 hypothetical protein [Methylorubrum populi]GJE79485.1 hypothetical protein CJNNKLLH_0811 [Methylorubrum thiocyanatum]